MNQDELPLNTALMASALMENPGISFWLKEALTTAQLRDPVDMLRDVTTLMYFCKARVAEAAKEHA